MLMFTNKIIFKRCKLLLKKNASDNGQSMTEFAIMLVMLLLISVALYTVFIALLNYGNVTLDLLSMDL